MIDDIDKFIKDLLPDIKNDQFSRLCFEVFMTNESGKTLMAHLFNEYIHRPFTNLLDKDPDLDTNKIIAKAVRRDLIQSLLLRAQQYELAIKQK